MFGYEESNHLRVSLHRKLKKITLPASNKIVLDKWQCHNLRASKLTHLR